MNVSISVVNDRAIVLYKSLADAKGGKSVRVKAVKGGQYLLAENDDGMGPENITVKRVGKNLHVALEGSDPDQPELVIENFVGSESQLVGLGEDSLYHEYVAADGDTDRAAAFLMEGMSSPLALGSPQLAGFGDGLVFAGAGLLPWVLAGVAGLAGGAIVEHHKEGGKKPKDTIAPENNGIGSIVDDKGPLKGSINPGDVTDDNRPTLGGSGQEPGDKVIVIDNGKVIGEAIVDGDGNWTFTPDADLGDGEHSLEIVVKDPSGNSSDPSDEIVIIIDTTAPTKPGVESIIDDQGAVTGPVENGGVTDDTQPTLSGKGDAGDAVTIIDNGNVIGEVEVDEDGTWTFTPGEPLSEGEHSFEVVVTDPAGNSSGPSDEFVITVDTTPPANPGIESVVDDHGAVTGPVANGGVTDDTQPTLSGKGDAGDTVTIIDNGEVIGEVQVGDTGTWAFTPEEALGEGEHVFEVVVTDQAGNSSEPSDEYVVNVDSRLPDKPVIETVYDDHGSQTGFLGSGDATDDAKPTIEGSAQANTIVIIRNDGVEIGRVPVGVDGRWVFEPSLPLALGTYKLTAVAVNQAGTSSAPSDRFDLVLVHPGAPAAPAITSVVDDVGNTTGYIQKNGVTDDARPTINGTAQAGMTVSVYVDGVLSGTVMAAANGEWSYTPADNLADGPHNLSATATNAVGNISPETGRYPINVDTKAPDKPSTGDAMLLDDEGAIVGEITDGMMTDDATPTFMGRGEPNGRVIIYNNGEQIGEVSSDANGGWTFTPSPALEDGEYSFSYRVVDQAGNISPESDAITFLVNTEGVLVSIDGATDDAGTVTGEIGKNGVTDDTSPTLHGKGSIGGTIKVYEAGALLGETVVDADGRWSLTPSVPMNEGPHSLTATITTGVDGESAHVGPFDFVIDLSAPNKPRIDSITDDVGSIQGKLVDGQHTDDTTPTLAGKAEPGSSVRIHDNGSLLGFAVADGNGSWSFTPTTPLSNGVHEFDVIAVDKAGNASEPSETFSINVDTVIPNKPLILSVYDDQGDVTGNLSPGAATDDSKPLLAGSAEANTTVVIKDKGVEIGRAPVGSDGKWSFEPTKPLSIGKHGFTAEAVDKAGNTSLPSDRFNLEVVTDVAPSVPAIISVVDDVGDITGNIQKNAVTDDARPTINGTAQAGTTVSIYIDGVLSGTAEVTANGEWSYTPSANLIDGLHNITAKAINGVGNVSPETGQYPINVDTRPADKPSADDAVLLDDAGSVTGPILDGTVTDDATPTFEGKGEPNGSVIIYDNGKEIGRVPSDANGVWNFTPSPALGDGSHSLSYEVVDQAGNVSPKSDPINFVVDTTGVKVSIDGALDNVGTITGEIDKNGVTDDVTPTLHGKGTIGGMVKVYEGSALLGEAVVDAEGKWSLTPVVPLSEGLHSLTATVTTAANGESERVGPFELTVDLTPPNVPVIEEINDDVGASQGALGQGQHTDDATPTLSGKADAGTTVSIYDKGSLLGSVVADPSGNWSFTPSPPLLNGAHDFTVTAQDKAGNESEASPVFGIVIDTLPPDAPVIEVVYDDKGSKTGNLNQGETTDDAIPTVSGKAEANSTVVIKDHGTEIGRVVADSDGKWVFEPAEALAAGEHKLIAEAIDAAGNSSASSSEFTFSVDDAIPTTPRITNIRDDVGEYTGILLNGGTTDDAMPTINGNGKAGETIEVRMDGNVLGTVVVGDNSRWSFTPAAPVADGVRVFTAVAVSAGGAESAISDAYQIRVDTVPPNAPIIEAVHDNAGVWTGNLENGQTTDDRTPTFSGRAEASSTIMVFNHGEEVGFASVDENGNWKYTADPLAYGEHRFTFLAFDVAGNLSDVSETWSVVVAAAVRSLGTGGVEASFSANELLVDGEVDMFNPATTGAGTAKVFSIAALGLFDQGILQDSWAINTRDMQGGANSWTRSTTEDANLFDQQLID